jgi:hypothetical protein
MLSENGSEQPDGFAQARRDGGADPGRPQRAVALTGADIGSDHGDQGAARSEDEGNQQIFDARTCAIACNSGGPNRPTRPVAIAMVTLVPMVISAATAPTRRMSQNKVS